MAQEDDDLQEVSSSSHRDLDNYEPSYDELEKAFDDLFGESKKLGAKNSILKKLLTSMTQEKENVEKALNVLKDEHEILKKDFKTQKETLENDKKILSLKIDDLTNLKGKGLDSSKRLYDCLSSMMPPTSSVTPRKLIYLIRGKINVDFRIKVEVLLRSVLCASFCVF